MKATNTKRARLLRLRKQRRSHARGPLTPGPPLTASFLLELFLPAKQRENFIGDLEQEFRTRILPKYGLRRARFWFWVQVGKEIGPVLYLRSLGALIRRLVGV